ncbi:hypothetical protein NLG97_g10519 [Lecanicillium saksenae]|uniref:Uncharacterized protein n=1 Tax=Lecanicillium saksenae TaxID=468837 RepID=A0ACC1QFY0_9HYPO|nr:hypothetical protein NLG97_g10519 [Lecanicillium saksenae]
MHTTPSSSAAEGDGGGGSGSGSSISSTNCFARALTLAWLSATSSMSILLVRNDTPSRLPKSRSLSSAVCVSGGGDDDEEEEQAAWMAAPVRAARCRSDVHMPRIVEEGKRAARCVASRSAWSTPCAVRAESVTPAKLPATLSTVSPWRTRSSRMIGKCKRLVT